MCGFSKKCNFSNNCDWKGQGYIINFKLTVRKPKYKDSTRKPKYKDSTFEVCIPIKELDPDDFYSKINSWKGDVQLFMNKVKLESVNLSNE